VKGTEFNVNPGVAGKREGNKSDMDKNIRERGRNERKK
jgi:hypothetical protein